MKVAGFRNYREARVEFPPGVTIIIGGNGAGKTSLLEAACYVIRGSSFRTSCTSDMAAAGTGAFRLDAELEDAARYSRSVEMEDGGVRVDAGGGPRWFEPGAVACFSPDDLMLIKGGPSGRRRFIDEALSRKNQSYRREIIDYQKTLSQRNSFLQRARAGLVSLADITPWDRQLAALAVKIHEARRRYCLELTPEFERAVDSILATGAAAGVRYISQLTEVCHGAEPEAALAARFRENWPHDLEHTATGVGIHRDDIEFTLGGASLKPYGSQGEQRTAVLALLLAERSLTVLAGCNQPLLLLDDVMSELDPGCRRRLMEGLTCENPGDCSERGQVLITAADKGLFTRDELGCSKVVYVIAGSLTEAGTGTNG